MTSQQRLSKEERQRRRRNAYNMRLTGATYQQITDALGYNNRSLAYRDVQTETAAQAIPDTEDPIKIDLARLDQILLGAMPKARKGDVAAGRLVMQVMEQQRSLRTVGTAERDRITNLEADLAERDAQLAAKEAEGTSANGVIDFATRLADRQANPAPPRRSTGG